MIGFAVSKVKEKQEKVLYKDSLLYRQTHFLNLENKSSVKPISPPTIQKIDEENENENELSQLSFQTEIDIPNFYTQNILQNLQDLQFEDDLEKYNQDQDNEKNQHKKL